MEIKPRLTERGTLETSQQSDKQTIAGLLATRSKMFNEAERLAERIAEIRNDISAVDRVLRAIGCNCDFDKIMPHQKVTRLFGPGELMRASLHEIRNADKPISSRDIARAIVEARGEDVADRKYLTEVTRRISKCLGKERNAGRVNAKEGGGNMLLWEKVR